MNGYVSWYGGARLQRWGTPKPFFDRLHAEHAFTLDGAADDENALLPKYCTQERDLPWTGERVFCNPPWSDSRRLWRKRPVPIWHSYWSLHAQTADGFTGR